MIFFLDENIPKKFISLLEGKGHEYIDIRGTDKEGMSDSDLIKMAKYRKAVLVTTDKDFFHTHHLLSKPHEGIIVIALRQPDSDSIAEKFIWFLEQHDEKEIKNRCFLILDRRIIIYD